MIRQSFVEERISDLHHHALQSSGDSDGEMSKGTSRRLPAPVTTSRIVIKKNTSLIPKGTEPVLSTSSTVSSPTPTVDPRSRIDLLERNLRYVQQQHEITLADLHSEINKLQNENRDLHFRMVNIRLPSASASKQRKSEISPNINQLADITQNEPVLAKRLQEVQRVHFEQQIDELRLRLIESEQRNEYLTRQIDELNRVTSNQTPPRTPFGVPVLLPDPNTSPDSSTTHFIDNKMVKSEEPQLNEMEYQHLLRISYDKQKQQIHEIARLRAVLREILHAERLSSTSKILVRDCLASTTTSEVSTTGSTDVSTIVNQQQLQSSVAPSTIIEKPSAYRQSTGHRRLSEHRVVLPPIVSGSNTSSLQGANDVLHNSLNPALYHQQQQQLLPKFSETPVARRGRRTQELQRTRLTRNLFH
ncbi:unnamed protein product [Adineta steineri]|uniref:CCDC92/74 N-terminal domain-containing protein n=1 Tax=Adineta steineri TaxID=433720 RepID=A0A815C8T6_9BILA|nr:unnamed protein product [Adineta steineri]